MKIDAVFFAECRFGRHEFLVRKAGCTVLSRGAKYIFRQLGFVRLQTVIDYPTQRRRRTVSAAFVADICHGRHSFSSDGAGNFVQGIEIFFETVKRFRGIHLRDFSHVCQC